MIEVLSPLTHQDSMKLNRVISNVLLKVVVILLHTDLCLPVHSPARCARYSLIRLRGGAVTRMAIRRGVTRSPVVEGPRLVSGRVSRALRPKKAGGPQGEQAQTVPSTTPPAVVESLDAEFRQDVMARRSRKRGRRIVNRAKRVRPCKCSCCI